MKTRTQGNNRILFLCLAGIVAILLSVQVMIPAGTAYADDDPPPAPEGAQVNPYLTVNTITTADGRSLTDTIISGPPTPPSGVVDQAAPVVTDPASATTLAVPTYSWVFGCSAVSGAMIAGYYDRNGYPNMYTGPTASGVMPLTDTSWSNWSDGVETYPNNPLIASHQGVDGRTTKGSIDDYWVEYGSSAQDPYSTGGWTQHSWGTAIGDYMKTSQYAYSNTDGSTHFYNWTSSADKLNCSEMPGLGISTLDGTYGRKLFAEARGYTVTDCYNQATDNKIAGGFSLANYKTLINAGKPVLLNLAGHSIVGVGYDTASSTIYIHDTWHSSGNQTMPWGGSYEGMELLSVSVVNLSGGTPPTTVPTPQAPSGSITDTTPTYRWTKVTSATQYQYQLVKGTTTVYTKTVPSSACTSTTCSNTPTTVLTTGAYKWRARAYVGGAWKTYSAYKNFTLSGASGGFNSQFNGSDAGWVDRPGGVWAATSTAYHTTGAANVWSSASYNAPFGNFTYQARVKRATNDSNGWSSGLVVRGAPTFNSSNAWKTAFLFLYDSYDRYFSVWKCVNWSCTPLKAWTYSPHIIGGNNWNTLKVIASGTSLKFYANSSLIWSGTGTGISTGQVGLTMYRPSTAQPFDTDWATLTTGTSSAALDESIEAGQIPLPIDPTHPQVPEFAPVP